MSVTISGTTITMNSGAVLGPISGNAPGFFCRAWALFNGTGTTGAAQSIYGSENISSIVKTATGEYNVNFAQQMYNANYVAHGASGTGAGLSRIVGTNTNQYPDVGTFAIDVYTTGGTLANVAYVAIAVFQ